MVSKLILLASFVLTLYSSLAFTNPYFPELKKPADTQRIEKLLPKGWPNDGLIVLPEAGRKVWIDAINSAKNTIHIAAYKLSDPTIVDALCMAARTGKVKIFLLLEPFTYKHDQSAGIESPVKKFEQAGIQVFYLSKRFNQAHYKTIIIDELWGVISTGNLDQESFDGLKEISDEPSRDFAVTLTDESLVKQVLKVFNADITDQRFVVTHPQIIVGPDEQRSVMLRLINSAQKSIKIYQQSIQDEGIAYALAHAAKSGIQVELLMMPFPFSKTVDQNIPNQKLIEESGGKVFLNRIRYIHAKVVIVDDEEAKNRVMYIGSGNFYAPSLERTRELGILIDDAPMIQRVVDIFEKDKINEGKEKKSN